MKTRLYFPILLFSLYFFNLQYSQAQDKNTRYQNQEDNNSCKMKLTEVQHKSFEIDGGTKAIITYSVTDFANEEDCWQKLEEIAASVTTSSDIAGVYFFTLSADKISSISSQNKDFSQYGKNLVAEYWKDPDSGPVLNRYPNVVTPEDKLLK